MAREHYLGGREHAAIKHYFLEQYLEVLCFKVLQARNYKSQPTFAYIDGFTGPWGARDRDYTDTSFGVALKVLQRVNNRLPNVKIRSVFCEERLNAFKKLEAHLVANAGNIDVKCYHGRFEDHILDIQSFVGKKGFRFAFIDPKGWNVDVKAIAPLLKDTWSEVLFTFMAEFIGRFPDFDKVRDSYSTLLGDVDWKLRFEALPTELNNDDKILKIFRDVLKEKWGFSHVMELPIRKVDRDRTFYKLVYGTRSPHGVIAFRDAQAKAEKEGHAIAFEAKIAETGDLFSADEHAEQIAASVGVGSRSNTALLPKAIKGNLQSFGPKKFLNVAADILEVIPAREKDIKIVAKDLAKMGAITFDLPDRYGNPCRKSLMKIS